MFRSVRIVQSFSPARRIAFADCNGVVAPYLRDFEENRYSDGRYLHRLRRILRNRSVIVVGRVQPINDVARLPSDGRLFQMRVSHRRADIGVAEHRFDLVDGQPVLDQTCRMGVS